MLVLQISKGEDNLLPNKVRKLGGALLPPIPPIKQVRVVPLVPFFTSLVLLLYCGEIERKSLLLPFWSTAFVPLSHEVGGWDSFIRIVGNGNISINHP